MIIQADARMLPIADQVVQCVVTSPPYFGLRDYGVDGQIGLEQTPETYVAALVGVFRGVRRVLKDGGTVWLNLGDSYAANRSYQVPSTKGGTKHSPAQAMQANNHVPEGLKPKDLIGIPWRVAFALQADGWYLRSDIIWAKPNPMPESVRDRPTRSHEYVFLLTKNARYYYDAHAIRNPPSEALLKQIAQGYEGKATKDYAEAGAQDPSAVKARILAGKVDQAALGSNARSVWTITPKPFKGAHFATFPPELVEKCVKAGSREGDLVLDPFGGSGTTHLVAERLGRRAVSVDLNPDYCRMAEVRCGAA